MFVHNAKMRELKKGRVTEEKCGKGDDIMFGLDAAAI